MSKCIWMCLKYFAGIFWKVSFSSLVLIGFDEQTYFLFSFSFSRMKKDFLVPKWGNIIHTQNEAIDSQLIRWWQYRRIICTSFLPVHFYSYKHWNWNRFDSIQRVPLIWSIKKYNQLLDGISNRTLKMIEWKIIGVQVGIALCIVSPPSIIGRRNRSHLSSFLLLGFW